MTQFEEKENSVKLCYVYDAYCLFSLPKAVSADKRMAATGGGGGGGGADTLMSR
ncbi:hypothetical protein E2C01_091814 [Portunus trituberculatus]|uniref:Uncharacterized protein n=1 Tax=Portunus trituberculatus TaxID=210409 RepID=A0A5B7JIJ6_PORTR|nr:hypothetical protein [Portunus trituberculatus]